MTVLPSSPTSSPSVSSKTQAGSEAQMVDWDTLFERIECAKRNIEETLNREKNPETILQERARLAAQSAREEVRFAQTLEVVEFLLAGERFAFPAEFIQEVTSLSEITPLPCVSSFVLGIVNLRGQIVAVMDLRVLLRLTLKEEPVGNLLFLRSDSTILGIRVDRIIGTRSIPADRLTPHLATLSGVQAEWLKGVSEDGVIVLDAGKILHDHMLRIEEEVE